jgi:hypothetical protein
MGLDGTARLSGWTRWLGLFGAIVLAAGLVAAYDGVGGADLSSAWNYCGETTTSVAVPCHCPQRDHQTSWPGGSIVCFTPAPDAAYLMADLGSAAVIAGALMLAAGNLLWHRRVGWRWLVIRSAITVVASVFVAALAALLAGPPPCVDCPSAPSDPAFASAAAVSGSAAVVVLVAALLPLGFRVVSRSRSPLKGARGSAGGTG